MNDDASIRVPEMMSRAEALELFRKGPAGILEWNNQQERHARDGWLITADLSNEDLSDLYLERANLEGVALNHATLDGANLKFSRMLGTHLGGASLRCADLQFAEILNCGLIGADFTDAKFGQTVITADLTGVRGLNDTVHTFRSDIAVWSVRTLGKHLPEDFLRGCGLSDAEIAHFGSQADKRSDFCSCFISYGSRDEEFATRLHRDFQTAGIRCWKWNLDARTGKKLWEEIDQAIRTHDKLVLIASESSLSSPGVDREIERAIQKEDQLERARKAGDFMGDTDVLFPVRLDDFIFQGWDHPRKADVTRKVIVDASRWKDDPGAYQHALEQLVRDLTAARLCP